MSKKGSDDFLSKKVDVRTIALLALVTFSLVTVFAEDMLGFTIYKSGAAYVDRGHFFSQSGQSACDNVGGNSFVVGGQSKSLYNKDIRLLSVSTDAILVSVDGAKRAIEPGYQKYVAGLYVTSFSTGTNDACLIVRNYQG